MTNGVKAWSYSTWSNYDLCPLQFKFRKIDKLPEPQGPAFAKGIRVHNEVAAYVTGKATTLPAEALLFPNMVNLIEEIRNIPAENKQVEQQWGYKADFSPTGWFDRGNEKVWFRSVLDVGVVYEDLTYDDVDWKTGKRYAQSNDLQMETQALSVFFRMPAVKHVSTTLAYLEAGGEVGSKDGFEYGEFPASVKQSLADKWRKKVQPMFEDTMFAPKPNDKCRFCHFSRSNTGKCAFG
jgi:RecB family exonuclease